MGINCNKFKNIALKLILAVVLIILILCIISISVSYISVKTTKYSISFQNIKNSVSYVVLSDLHDSSFGEGNERLIRKVKECEPDVIFTVGDMVSEYCEDYSYLTKLYNDLAEIAPVYCSLGNHELSHPESEEIKEILSNKATLLENEYIDTAINGNEIRLGSLSDYHPSKDNLNNYIREFADTDKFTLLLSHCPEYYTWGVDEVKIDLMVSGHTHGGQVILPFIGGLFAPEQGYFPKYDYGVFYEENATIVVTQGLGTSRQILPRFNNPPEILCLTLEAQNGK